MQVKIILDDFLKIYFNNNSIQFHFLSYLCIDSTAINEQINIKYKLCFLG
jgi:hypothetical protein